MGVQIENFGVQQEGTLLSAKHAVTGDLTLQVNGTGIHVILQVTEGHDHALNQSMFIVELVDSCSHSACFTNFANSPATRLIVYAELADSM